VDEPRGSAGKARHQLILPPRDHYPFVTHTVLQQILLRRYRVTPQQVRDVHFLQVIDTHPAVGQIHEAGDTAYVQRQGFEKSENFAPTRARSRGDCEQYFLRPGFLDHPLDMFRLIYLKPGDDPHGDTAVVIDERHRLHAAPHTQG